MRTLLIDNHDSYTYNLFHLLAQVNGEDPVVVPNDTDVFPDLDAYDNLVISPGPGHPSRARDFGVSTDVLRKAGLPVLGVCLGHQGLAVCEGGSVVAAPAARHGQVARVTHDGDPLFDGVPETFGAVRYHSLCVAEPLPPDLEVIARAEDGVVMALRHRRLPRWGVQFHPESVETEYGLRMMANFRDLTLGDQRRTGRRPAPATTAPARAAEPARPAEALRYRLHVRVLERAVDCEAAFAELYSGATHAFWLDSARVSEGLSRFSFLGDATGPLAETVRYSVTDREVRVSSATPATHQESVLDYLQRELGRRHIEAPELPFDFTGGYVGYLGYETRADCGAPGSQRAETPDAVWLFADRFLAVDHREERTYLLALSADGADERTAEDWLTRTGKRLDALRPLPEPEPADPLSVEPFLDRGRADYTEAVTLCQTYLHRGESYEICLTNSADLPGGDDGWDTYRRLRRLNPAPYAAYLHLDDVDVACSSPERFLRIDTAGLAETKPIKGTAPRGATPEEDEAIRRELAASAKTRAENLMIVDLLRNDLGRVCEVGSVRVPVLMATESYATVHQLVTTVQGRLGAGTDAVDCVRACFPGGSMTGAPKQRTLEIIESLERRPRGVYSGSLGYLACNGSADLNIVIRTLVRSGGHWKLGAGGAIVLASDPDEEYEEMLLKAAAPARALRAPRLAAAAAPVEANGSDPL
ncbi:aminodeoxychorismate synthase component I [Streptomyces sp. AJS327]|uniref:aminodeoxychorismate synthase component I n=1 Tax=Streptomyces sp. AJS327 TaxID=2545265 RepID=UPI0015DF1E8E|nr:aminodeoxychorismate synthase component I [Streptomyces sp. AJS327]MBA0052618.1 aminodeoxychorismate synthase component I [Streptomyces sp. AJS327]